MVPKGTDLGFTEKLHDGQKKGSALAAVKGLARANGFQLAHFAGQVTYSTAGWLDKNKDPLNGDLVVLMQFSDNELLKELFTEPADVAPAAGDRKKFKSTKFKGVTDTFSFFDTSRVPGDESVGDETCWDESGAASGSGAPKGAPGRRRTRKVWLGLWHPQESPSQFLFGPVSYYPGVP